MPPKKIKKEPRDTYEIEKILDVRLLKYTTRVLTQYLVKWKGYPEDQSTWEFKSNVTITLIKEFEKRNPNKRIIKGQYDSITVIEANSASTQAGSSRSIKVVETKSSATQVGSDRTISQAETVRAATRSAARNTVKQDVDNSRQDKSTQTANYVFEKYSYK